MLENSSSFGKIRPQNTNNPKSITPSRSDNMTGKGQKLPTMVDEEAGQKDKNQNGPQDIYICGVKVPASSTLVSVIKLCSLLYFASAASLILMGIEFSDGNLYVKIHSKELFYTLVFFGIALVLIVNSAIVLNSVNRKLTQFSRQYLVLGPFIVFIISAGVFIMTIQYNDQKVVSGFNTDCKNPTSQVANLDSYVQGSYKVMCSFFCPCQLKDFPVSAANNQQFFMDNDMGYTRIQDCITEKHPDIGSAQNQAQMNMATKMEKEFKCAGVCTPVDFYVFTDTLRGRPHQTCLQVMIDEFQGATQQVLVTAILSILGSLITGIAGFTLARHYQDFDPTLDYTNQSIELQISNSTLDASPLLTGLDHTEIAIRYHNLQGAQGTQGQQYQAPKNQSPQTFSPSISAVGSTRGSPRTRADSELIFINQLTPKPITNVYQAQNNQNMMSPKQNQSKTKFMKVFEPAFIGLAANTPNINMQLNLERQPSTESQKSLALSATPHFMNQNANPFKQLAAKPSLQPIGRQQRTYTNVTDNLFNLSGIEATTPLPRMGDEQTIDGISSIGGRRLSINNQDKAEFPDFKNGDQDQSSMTMTGLDLGQPQEKQQKGSPNFGNMSGARQNSQSTRKTRDQIQTDNQTPQIAKHQSSFE